MKKQMRLLILLLYTGSLLQGCDKQDGEEATGPGFVSGRVTNVQGQPLQGAEIVVRHVFSHQTMLKAVTGKKGKYSIALPAEQERDEWTVNGNYKLIYDGKEYIMELDGDLRAPFSGSTGAVVNFVLKQSGRQPSGGPGAPGRFFGGVISCYPGDGADMSKVTITARPIQPLIDGSMAQTKTLRPELEADLSWVVNVPIGLYEISARESNTTLYLRDYTRGIPDSGVTRLVRQFEPCPVNGAGYWIKFDVLKNQ